MLMETLFYLDILIAVRPTTYSIENQLPVIFFILNRRPISWASCKQPIVFTLTCEIEYIVQTEAAYGVVWIRGLLEVGNGGRR